MSGNKMNIPLRPDEEGYTGRECPDCERYFKLVFGTGLKGTTHCICPYCGHKAGQSEFTTKEQVEYAKSVAVNHISSELLKSMKSLEGRSPPQRSFLKIEIKVTGSPTPISYYSEKSLETKIVCRNCTLSYAVYGVFAYCPDCGEHNSHQILTNNLQVINKLLATMEGSAADVLEAAQQMALQQAVAAFDAYGREICNIYANKSSTPDKARQVSFQNPQGAQKNILGCFGIDIAAGLPPAKWQHILRMFQKRHLLSHKAGVIDDDYITKANDPNAEKGRKVTLTREELSQLLEYIEEFGTYITAEFQRVYGPPT